MGRFLVLGRARKPPGGTPVARGAPWAPNDQDDIGDNTQHILPPSNAHLSPRAHKVSLSSSSDNTTNNKTRKLEACVV